MQRLWKCDIWIAEFRGFYRIHHRQPNVMVACAQAHVAQARDCIVVDTPNFMHLRIYREYKQFCVNDKISDLVKFLYHLI